MEITSAIKKSIDQFDKCSNMIGIENVILQCGLSVFKRYKKQNDPVYDKLNRVLFRKIPHKFSNTKMYLKLKNRIFI